MRRHFTRAVDILEPTLLTAQGLGVRQWLRRVITATAPADPTWPIEHVEIGGRRILLVMLGHPSAPTANNWGRNDRQPYLLDTVAPTIDRVRARLDIA